MIAIAFQVFLLAGLASFLATPAVIWLAKRIGAVDQPDRRKVHTAPIPRIGGIAVFSGFIVGVGFAELHDMAPQFGFHRPSIYYAMLLGAVALFALGLFDDLRSVGFLRKFAVQIFASVVVWSAGFRVQELSVFGSGGTLHLGWMSLPLTVLWIVGITNAVNLIDGLDGLAVGTALITTVAVTVMALLSGQTGVLACSSALVGSLVGFLPFNFNPARIFLGDGGSLFLGFVLAVISIRSQQKGTTAVAALTPILILALPILDTSLAIARRTWRIGVDGWREGAAFRYVTRNSYRVFLPDRGHLHHRLLDLGLSHRRAVLTMYVFAGVLAAAAFFNVLAKGPTIAFLLVCVLAVGVATFVTTLYLARPRGRIVTSPKPEGGPPAQVANRPRHGA